MIMNTSQLIVAYLLASFSNVIVHDVGQLVAMSIDSQRDLFTTVLFQAVDDARLKLWPKCKRKYQ